jgi:hypothetical protein
MKNKLYIAYGSNLNLTQMAKRCPTAKVLGASEIKDYALVFRGEGMERGYHRALRGRFCSCFAVGNHFENEAPSMFTKASQILR